MATKTNGRTRKQEAAGSESSDVLPTMLAFLKWFFRTLDPRFTQPLFAGRSVEEAAEQLFACIASTVRGKRARSGNLTAADYGAMMDCIAALHLQTRHGEEAVSNSALSEIRAVIAIHGRPASPPASSTKRKEVSNGH